MTLTLMPKLIVDDEFSMLMPLLSDEERGQLEENLKAQGCRDALVVWPGKKGPVLLDGHNRYEICRRLEIPYRTTEIGFLSRNDACLWIINNQLGRRNLEPYQRAEMGMVLKEGLARQAQEREKAGRAGNPGLIKGQGRTDDAIGKVVGLSGDTIHKAEVIKKQGTEAQKAALRKGETTINREYKAIKGKAAPQQSGARCGVQSGAAADVLRKAEGTMSAGFASAWRKMQAACQQAANEGYKDTHPAAILACGRWLTKFAEERG